MPALELHAWSLTRLLMALAAGLAGGAMNSVGGGGSILTFPALLWLGVPGKLASATNSLAVWPGTLTGGWVLRREIRSAPRRWWPWLIPALLGGAAGAWLLLITPGEWFLRLAPLLVLFATVLLARETLPRGKSARQPPAQTAQPAARGREPAGLLLLLAIAVYGGYFGAGMGILLLADLGLMGWSELRSGIGVKNLLALAIKSVAIVIYIYRQMIVWPAALVLAAGTGLGGWAGAHLTRRLPQRWLRRLLIALGILISLKLILQPVH